LLENNDDKRAVKKIKLMYKLEKETEKLIIADVINKKYWDDCKELLVKGQKVCIFIVFKCTLFFIFVFFAVFYLGIFG